MSRGRSIDNVNRAPAPEWEEFACAAWPGRVPVGLSVWFGRSNVTIFGLAIVVLLASAWLRQPWVAFGAWTVAALSEWLSTRAASPSARRLDAIGLRAPLRGLLRSLLAAGVVFADAAVNSPTAGLTYITVVLVVQATWLMQPTLAAWAASTAPVLLFVPGQRQQRAATARYARIYARGVGTPAVLVGVELIALLDAVVAEFQPAQSLSALLGVTVAGAMAETALIYLGWTAWQAFTARRDVAKMGRPVIDGLTALAPSYLVHLSGDREIVPETVNTWLPALDAVPVAGMIVARDARQLGTLVPTKRPVVYAPEMRDMARMVLPSVVAAFYVGHGAKDAQLRADPRLTQVLLAPLGSDKASDASNLVAGFDEVWVAGQATLDRWLAAGVRVDPERVVIIGRPSMLAAAELTPSATPVVLYAPTFEGYEGQPSYTSLDRGGSRLIRHLLRTHPEVQVWFRPHPLSGVSRASMETALTEITTLLRRASGGHRIIDAELTAAQCLAGADVLITDISALAADFLATGRPIITSNLRGLSAEEFAETYPAQAASYLFEPNLTGLDEALAEALGGDRLRSARAELSSYVLGDPTDGPQAALAANIARVTNA